nr:MAG TPA: hypothetical protein [Caudoviricetes sp.]
MFVFFYLIQNGLLGSFYIVVFWYVFTAWLLGDLKPDVCLFLSHIELVSSGFKF